MILRGTFIKLRTSFGRAVNSGKRFTKSTPEQNYRNSKSVFSPTFDIARTSRGRRVIRTCERYPVISLAGMRYPDLLSRSEKERDAPRGNRLIRDKFCAIGSVDKTRELAGTRKYDPQLVYETIDRRRSPAECYAHTPEGV